MDRFKEIKVIVYNQDNNYEVKAASIAAEVLYETLEKENIVELIKRHK
ncbi:MAG: hypothetical protein ACM3X7_03310 [Solirubrobacterales bacterium]